MINKAKNTTQKTKIMCSQIPPGAQSYK